MVDVSDYFFEFLENYSLFDNSFNFLHSFIFVSQFNNFLVFFCYLLNALHDDWNFNDFLDNVLDVFVNINQLRNNLFDLDDSWNFNKFFFDSLNLIDLRYNNRSINNFFNDLLGSHDFSDNIMYRYDFFNDPFYLVDLSSHIRNLFDNFFDFSINNNFLFSANDFDGLRFNSILDNNFLENGRNLNNFFNGLSHWYKFLDNSINWD
jgi:hypothetical protein